MDALRAQGLLSEEKLHLLRDLRTVLHISDDRHKAEARRVANDERLATISDLIVGCETYRDWAREGRRAVPLLPRGIPETALIKVADNLAQRMQEQNNKFPLPEQTKRNRSAIEALSFYEAKKTDVRNTAPVLQPTAQTQTALKESQLRDVEGTGWNRKRRIINDNYALNQQLYPNVMKAQMAGRRGQKRPRKEKKQKLPPPPLFPKVDYEESINQLQPLNNQGFNRIIHSYASNPVNMDIVPQQPKQQEVPPANHVQNIKEPKVQILSNEPVKIIPALALRNLQAKGNVKLVPSPPAKVVLRPLSDTTDATARVTHTIKGIPAAVAGTKLNVQLMQGKSSMVVINKSEAAIQSHQQNKSVVQIVNSNGELTSSSTTKPTIVRNISAPIGLPNVPRNPSNFIKLDPSQIKCLRIVSVPTSSASNVSGDKVMLTQKSSLATPINKLLKDSKIYPINYNNGTSSPIVIEPKLFQNKLPESSQSLIPTVKVTQTEKTKTTVEKHHLRHSEGEGESSHGKLFGISF